MLNSWSLEQFSCMIFKFYALAFFFVQSFFFVVHIPESYVRCSYNHIPEFNSTNWPSYVKHKIKWSCGVFFFEGLYIRNKFIIFCDDSTGIMYEARGEIEEALGAYSNALSMDLDHVPCKVSVGALLWKRGLKSSCIARGFLSDVLKREPTNRSAWYYLGMVHKEDGRLSDAAECFQAASMLDESEPIESFDSIVWIFLVRPITTYKCCCLGFSSPLP